MTWLMNDSRVVWHETISNHPSNRDPFSSFEPHKHVQFKNATCSAHFQTTHSAAPAPATIFNTWFFQEKSWRPKNISCAPAMAPAVTFEVHQARLNFPRFVLGLHPATQSDNSIIVFLLKKLRKLDCQNISPKKASLPFSFMAYSFLRVSSQRRGGGPSCCTWSILRWSPKPGFPKPVLEAWKAQDKERHLSFPFSMPSMRASPVKSPLALLGCSLCFSSDTSWCSPTCCRAGCSQTTTSIALSPFTNAFCVSDSWNPMTTVKRRYGLIHQLFSPASLSVAAVTRFPLYWTLANADKTCLWKVSFARWLGCCQGSGSHSPA